MCVCVCVCVCVVAITSRSTLIVAISAESMDQRDVFEVFNAYWRQ